MARFVSSGSCPWPRLTVNTPCDTTAADALGSTYESYHVFFVVLTVVLLLFLLPNTVLIFRYRLFDPRESVPNPIAQWLLMQSMTVVFLIRTPDPHAYRGMSPLLLDRLCVNMGSTLILTSGLWMINASISAAHSDLDENAHKLDWVHKLKNPAVYALLLYYFVVSMLENALPYWIIDLLTNMGSLVFGALLITALNYFALQLYLQVKKVGAALSEGLRISQNEAQINGRLRRLRKFQLTIALTNLVLAVPGTVFTLTTLMRSVSHKEAHRLLPLNQDALLQVAVFALLQFGCCISVSYMYFSPVRTAITQKRAQLTGKSHDHATTTTRRGTASAPTISAHRLSMTASDRHSGSPLVIAEALPATPSPA